MSETNNAVPKIIKFVGIFVVVFFMLVIAFNIWMRASLEKPGSPSVTSKIVDKPVMQKTDSRPENKGVPRQIMEETQETDDVGSDTGRQLLLQ